MSGWPNAHQALRDHDLSPDQAGAQLSFGGPNVTIDGCVLVAAAVVDTMMRDPAIVANAIMHLDRHHRDQVRVLLDKLADVGM